MNISNLSRLLSNGAYPEGRSLDRLSLSSCGVRFGQFHRITVLALKIMASAAIVGFGSSAFGQDEEDDDEVIELSPFVVDARGDTGYRATSTISGTRLNTSVNDLASAQSIMTKEFLEDLGATSFEEALQFAPNTGSDAGGIADDPLGNRGLFFNTYRVRGFRLDEGLTTNFLFSAIPGDVYNIERISFSRGPNSILFGLGSPGGNSNQVSSRARFRDSNEISVRLDSDNSRRVSASVNRVLIDKKLAVRASSVVEESFTHRKPSGREQFRYYLAATYKPFEKTTFRAFWETGEIDQMNVRPWTTSDYVTPWLEAGMPTVTVPASVTTPNPEPGLDRLTNGNWATIVTGNGYGTPVGVQNWRRMGKTAMPAERDRQNFASITDSSVVPLETNLLGGGQSVDIDFENLGIFMEQELVKNWFVEIALNKQNVRRDVWNTVGAGFDEVYADPNEVLPDGTANPNFGDYYVESNASTRFLVDWEIETMRMTSSYELNLAEKFGEFGKRFLGRNRFAVLAEQRETEGFRPIFMLSDTSGQLNANPFAGWNRVKHRFYIDPDNGYYGAPRLGGDAPIVWGSENMAAEYPAPDELGLQLAWLPIDTFDPLHTMERLNSKMFTMQNYFWEDRIIGIFGWRDDSLRIWEGPRSEVQRFGRFWEDISQFDPKEKWADDARDIDGSTRTAGLVFRPVKNLSFYYNDSSSFKPVTAGFVDIYGERLINESGEGNDYGIRYTFMDGKAHLNVNWFKTSLENERTGSVNGATGIGIRGAVDNMWQILADNLGETQYLEFPYKATSNWSGYANTDSDGVEISVTANPTKAWRLHFNIGKNENVRSVFGVRVKEYLDEFIPFWQSDPSWGALVANPDEPVDDPKPFSEFLTDAIDARSRLNSLEGAQDGRRPIWSFNMNTAYSFREGGLKNFTLGGNARWRDETVIGYPTGAFGEFLIDEAYFGEDPWNVGVFGRYQRDIGQGNMRWTVQLNINNVLDDDDIRPFNAVEGADGNPIIGRWELPRGRTFVLTNTLKF